jgi:gamma-glutamyltranspeptidase/glutathione hydrolase
MEVSFNIKGRIMKFKENAQQYPFPSRRMVTVGKNGMVATSQNLAAQAGLDILKKGGNAVDAAIATAACLTVVEPTSNGIGGDNFAIVWMKEKLHGLNSSGPSPLELSIDTLEYRGLKEMPRFGWYPVTVPGVPGGWAELNRKFGNLTLSETLAPAIQYAEEGFPLSPHVCANWKKAFRIYKEHLKEECFEPWFRTFAPNGRAPEAGEVITLKDHGKTLREIGNTRGESFYRGKLADSIVKFSSETGGFFCHDDLDSYRPQWVDPVSINYRGYDVWELPPNGQGIIALMALNILKNDDLASLDEIERYHRQIEAVKLAFSDGKAFITDPDKMKESVSTLLSDEYCRVRREEIGREAIIPSEGKPPKGGTVYLATADGDGNMVSFIQSNYMGFGSGLVVPGTGISLQNRGHSFSLDRDHINSLEPGKRPYHTIIPGFMTKNGKAVGPFGVMGGFMQPQGHLQVIMNTLDFHMNPQSALDAPRWQWMEGKKVLVERGIPLNTVNSLERRGHEISYHHNAALFGRGQIIWRDKDGILWGGTEGRADSAVLTY